MTTSLPSLLIADDDDRIRYLVREAADRSGIYGTIHEVADGRAALDYIRNQLRAGEGVPDFVLSDLSMPRIDGVQLLRELKAHSETESIPVAIMTSSNQPNDRDEALAAGCSAFFYKPTRFDEIVAMVASLPALYAAH